MTLSTEPGRPRIVVLISHLKFNGKPSRLARTLEEILPRYHDQADIEIVESTVANLLPTVQQLEEQRDIDVIVCSGASADFLRKKISTSVLSIRMGEYDLIKALNLAKDRGTKAGILSHQRPHAELRELTSLLTVEISEAVYTSFEDARQKTRALVDAGFHVIIGSPTAVELAEDAGAVGVSAINAEAVRRTLDDAVAICRSREHERQKNLRISAVLKHLNEGVMALDAKGRIQSVNNRMEYLTGVAERKAIGLNARDLLPNLEIDTVLRQGEGEENQLIQVNDRKLAINIIPIFEANKVDGLIVACQEINAIQRADRRIRSQTRPSHFIARYEFSDLLGDSAPFRQAVHMAKLYAKTDSTVLITGESGTGKELLAQSIHNASDRHQAPFVAINCAAFPEALLESELFGYEEGAFTGSRKGGKGGLFEAAHTGTIFLDEIGDMPVSLQTRLLRVLQEREVLRLGASEPTPVNIRVISATHQNLQERVLEGQFRQDLYFRLNILRVEAPSLRDRISDLPLLAQSMVDRLAQNAPHKHVMTTRLIDHLMPQLMSHPWQGNIRELENIVERAFLSAEFMNDSHADTPPIEKLFPELNPATASSPDHQDITGTASLQAISKASELTHIRQTLDSFNGDMSRTAKHLGISRSTLWRKLRKTS
ncbi:propionate catabolism operon regulatory protein PrpR [Marinobacter sp. F3R08]|uniref:propionate catabolism operon regulatory protein PrpR n=1 Tax=Marinobacter sp. F3R08 TaxID=2841559 RepID=UPI001C099725|nr:propionate catabolism operon regulatory protein PrpR [Marinobacter sp. F3R08]MBU2952916.1 propionate catabolism operon regulatory protein PrpR [Marinobacter sp. F3R08]